MKEVLKQLKDYGIEQVDTLYYNLSYDELFEHETAEELTGYEKGTITSLGAVAVDTGIFTGRSPKDKYIVDEETSRDNIWWKKNPDDVSDNKPISPEVWKRLYGKARDRLNGRKLYVQDGYVGANEDTRMKIRIITEVAWMAHFVKNMFIRPTEEELKDFKPDFVMLNACKTKNEDYKEDNLNSDVFVAFNLKEKRAVVGGTWYGGEIKKGFFSMMNYFLPLKNIAAMHCSANVGADGVSAIFFGLSGTGKTTLSTDPNRSLIGDDEHGWDDNGIFNFEGGCYAKTYGLKEEKEPEIYHAIRKDALLENVVYNDAKEVDFDDKSKTENGRVSYPIYHIDNIVKPISSAGHAKNVIFLTCDAYGVLPPVSKLDEDQAQYYFLQGYTAKVAGTERGLKEPKPSFSACFGAAFLLLHPMVYAERLMEKVRKHGAKVWLVNTGWVGGSYGVGERIDLKTTRKLINAILSGELAKAEFVKTKCFKLSIPKNLAGFDSDIFHPRNIWKDKEKFDETAHFLAEKFIENFKNYTDNPLAKEIEKCGPCL